MQEYDKKKKWEDWKESFRACRKTVFRRVMVLVPVLICFVISAVIEILVFRSILTVLGFATVAVFLALSLELFKLVVPVLFVRDGSAGAALQNGVVLALRFVLFFISFCCTFIAISNNLVDVNAQEVRAQNQAISAQITADFKQEYAQRMQQINSSFDKQIEDKRDAYDIPSKSAALDNLSETYAQGSDWATYGLIVEMNGAIAAAQEKLNADLDAIEQLRQQQLTALSAVYSDQKLQQKVDTAVTVAQSGGKYDQSQNTSITKVLYLLGSTLGVEPSYELVVILIAALVCLASECIIWTGSLYLINGNREEEKKREGDALHAFQKEMERRLDQKETDPASLSMDWTSIPSIALFDKGLMKKLARLEQKNIDRRLNLMMAREKKAYRTNMREVKRTRHGQAEEPNDENNRNAHVKGAERYETD